MPLHLRGLLHVQAAQVAAYSPPAMFAIVQRCLGLGLQTGGSPSRM